MNTLTASKISLVIDSHESLQSAKMSYGSRVQANARYIDTLSQASLDAKRNGDLSTSNLFRKAITDMSTSVATSHATARQAVLAHA